MFRKTYEDNLVLQCHKKGIPYETFSIFMLVFIKMIKNNAEERDLHLLM